MSAPKLTPERIEEIRARLLDYSDELHRMEGALDESDPNRSLLLGAARNIEYARIILRFET